MALGPMLREVDKPLDATDQALIKELQRDGRASNVELAKGLGLSEGAIRHRIRKLIERKLIRVVAVEDPVAGGRRTHVVICLRTEIRRLEEIAASLAAMPELSYVYVTSGPYDIVAVAFFESDAELHDFLTSNVAKMPGILRTETFHIMRTLRRVPHLGQPIDTPDAQPR